MSNQENTDLSPIIKETKKQTFIFKRWTKKWNIATIITVTAAIISSIFLIRGCFKENEQTKNYAKFKVGEIEINENEPIIILYLYPYFNTLHDIREGLLPFNIYNSIGDPIKNLEYCLATKQVSYKEKSYNRFKSNEHVLTPKPVVREHNPSYSKDEHINYRNISVKTLSRFWIPEPFSIDPVVLPDSVFMMLGNANSNIPILEVVPLIIEYSHDMSKQKTIQASMLVLQCKNIDQLLERFVNNNSPFPEMKIKDYIKKGNVIQNYKYIVVEVPPVRIENGELTLNNPSLYRCYSLTYRKTGDKKAYFELYDSFLNVIERIDYDINTEVVTDLLPLQ